MLVITNAIYRLSAEERQNYFDRVLHFVTNNDNIDNIEDAINGDGNIGGGGDDNGDDIDGYNSDDQVGQVEFDIDEINDSDWEENDISECEDENELNANNAKRECYFFPPIILINI